MFHSKAQTWLSVSTDFTQDPVDVFQIFIWRSAVPPPVANKFVFQGHHESALTAAVCSVKAN